MVQPCHPKITNYLKQINLVLKFLKLVTYKDNHMEHIHALNNCKIASPTFIFVWKV